MKFFAHINLIIATLFLGASSYASQVPVADSNAVATVTAVSDTLINLNTQLHGLADIIVSKESVVPKAIEIGPKGEIILHRELPLKPGTYTIDIKATARDGEVYTINLKLKNESDKITVITVCDKIDMATGFRAEGKIYIVITVSLILFFIVIAYLLMMDRKMKKLNARLESHNSNQ